MSHWYRSSRDPDGSGGSRGPRRTCAARARNKPSATEPPTQSESTIARSFMIGPRDLFPGRVDKIVVDLTQQLQYGPRSPRAEGVSDGQCGPVPASCPHLLASRQACKQISRKAVLNGLRRAQHRRPILGRDGPALPPFGDHPRRDSDFRCQGEPGAMRVLGAPEFNDIAE